MRGACDRLAASRTIIAPSAESYNLWRKQMLMGKCPGSPARPFIRHKAPPPQGSHPNKRKLSHGHENAAHWSRRSRLGQSVWNLAWKRRRGQRHTATHHEMKLLFCLTCIWKAENQQAVRILTVHSRTRRHGETEIYRPIPSL